MNSSLSLNRRLVLTAAFSALIVVLTFTNLGFLSFSPVVSITILPIPVVLVAFLAGFPEALFAGFIFGLMSLIKAATAPTGILDPLFVNPLCSILPRVLFAAIAWGLWKLLNLIPHMPKPISAAIAAFASTFAHTLLVYGCIFIFKGQEMNAALASMNLAGYGFFAVVGLGIVSEMLEAAASLVVSAAVFTGFFIAESPKSKLSGEDF